MSETEKYLQEIRTKGVDEFLRATNGTGLNRPRLESPGIYQSQTYASNLQCDMQDQLATFRSELKRKDDLIRQLSGFGNPCNPCTSSQSFDTSKIEALLASDRHSTQKTFSQMTELKCELEARSKDLCEERKRSETLAMENKKYHCEVETLSETNARLEAVISTLKCKIQELQQETGCYQNNVQRGAVAIEAIQKENEHLKCKVNEYAERITKHLNEKEDCEQRFAVLEKYHREMIIQLKAVFKIDDCDPCNETALSQMTDCVLQKFAEMVQQNAVDKAKILRFQEEIETLKVEEKANRETIQRLVGDVNNSQRSSIRITTEMDNLKKERDAALFNVDNGQKEIQQLKIKIETLTRTLNSRDREIEEYIGRTDCVSKDIRDREANARCALQQFQSLKECLAALLSTGDVRVCAAEDEIKKHVELLRDANRDKDAHIELLRSKYEQARCSVEENFNCSKAERERHQQIEEEALDLRRRLKQYENDLSSNEVMRCGLKQDREKYLAFLELLSKKLQMDKMTADCGLDMSCDAILARVEQLVRNDTDCLAGKSSQIYTMQRKIKTLKEQVESKDLHLDLLRKKVASLEERLCGRSTLEREKDNDCLRLNKLEKLCDKYRCQLEQSRNECQELKAQLLCSSETKVSNCEQSRQLESLEKEICQLKLLNDEQAKQLLRARREGDCYVRENDTLHQSQDSIIKNFQDENKQLKMALDETRRREQELLDQRAVIGRMLGLEVNNLAVPAYELIERLRRLVEANHATFISRASSCEDLVAPVNSAYRSGYHKGQTACWENATTTCVPPLAIETTHCSTNGGQGYHHSKHHRSRKSSTKTHYVRARSVSPARKVDTKSY